jgi:hypothetical protein
MGVRAEPAVCARWRACDFPLLWPRPWTLGSSSASDFVVRAGNFVSRAPPHFIDALVTMAIERTNGWWEDCRGLLPTSFLDLSELEHHAGFLRHVAIL